MNKHENWKGARWYTTPNGKEYPSVTTILSVIGKPALIAWSAKVEREMVTNVSADLYQDIAGTPKMSKLAYLNTLQTRLGKEKAHSKALAKAGDIGSQIHSLIEWTLRASLMEEPGPSPHICDKAQWGFMAWEDWRKSVNLKPVYVEQTVFSERYGYAGTMDLLAYVNGVLTVLDWKSGKAIYPESYLQNAAYRHAIREMGHGDPAQGIIVRLPKIETDPEFEVKECPPEKHCMEKFLNAKALWEWVQANDTYKPAEPKPESTPDNQLEAKLCESIARANGPS